MDDINMTEYIVNIATSIGFSGITLFAGFKWFVQKKIESKIDMEAKKSITKYEKDIEAANNEKIKQLELSNNLMVNQFEFDTYKKQIVFPELQKINSYIDEYIMLTNNYDRSILNKNSEYATYENRRLTLDEGIIESISTIKIYLPNDFSRLLERIRVIFSNSFRSPKTLYLEFINLGYHPQTPLDAKYKLLERYLTAFLEMSRLYISMKSNEEKEYDHILANNMLDEDAKIRQFDTLTIEYAYKRLMLSEYYPSSEIVDIQNRIEEGIKEGKVGK